MLTSYLGGKLFGERTGEGQPKVLGLHGWGRSHSDLRNALLPFDAIALDLPGFGVSPPPVKASGSAEYGTLISPILDEFAEPPVILGHSMGGRLALWLAANYPEKVRGLVLTGVPLVRPSVRQKTLPLIKLAKWANRVGLLSDAKLERQRQKRGSADYRAARGVMRESLVRFINESHREEIAQTTCPVELVWGEIDTAAKLSMVKEAMQGFAHANLTVIAGGDHDTALRQPQELHAALRRRLA